MGEFGIGQSIPRFEDPRLLRGQGRFVDDINLPEQAYMVVVRSPHAAARIHSIDVAAAAAAPGVIAVLTGDDFAAEGFGTTAVSFKRQRPDGSPMFARPHPGLARGRVRYVGDPVAVVIAGTVAQAKDAAELVAIDYEPLPAVASLADAARPGAPAVWDECPDNVSHVFEMGDRAATDAAFARAARVVRGRYPVTRVHGQYMEPRGAIGHYDEGENRFTLHAGSQYAHRTRGVLATDVFRIPEPAIRVVVPDVGGSFGVKGPQYVEDRLVLWAARKLRRPVKWTCERSETILADEHARDRVSDAELALDRDGRFLALRVRTIANVGAYISSDRNLLGTFNHLGTMAGTYAIGAAYAHLTCVMTNQSSLGPYRGNGRPEATYVIERLIDDAARELGLDPVELRRRNLVPAAAMPYQNAFGWIYDSGDYARSMELALAAADHAGFAARRDASRGRGRLRGRGVVNAIERAAAPGLEYAEIRFDPSGTATVLTGAMSQGQAHETTFKQILHDRLGLDPGAIRYLQGDTDKVAFSVGSFGSRSAAIAGSALVVVADKLIAKGRRIAAHLLEAADADIEFAAGRFTVAGTDRSLDLRAVAKAAFAPDRLPPGVEPGFFENGTFSPAAITYPNGCHVCEVEIDPETGTTAIVGYTVVDDVGTVVNPLTLKGQIHGGVVQGAGQALMEKVVYDPASGQLLSASFMDYCMPRADDFCAIEVKSNPAPTPLNPLGIKGAGEAGAVGALPAVMNAVVDALAQAGAPAVDMPASAERVWRALRGAGPR
jgi:aerobic carbon-monoxide dehydrogenase large subunit